MKKDKFNRLEDKYNFKEYQLKIVRVKDRKNDLLQQAHSILHSYWPPQSGFDDGEIVIMCVLKDKQYTREQLYLRDNSLTPYNKPFSVVGVAQLSLGWTDNPFGDGAVIKDKEAKLQYLAVAPLFNTAEGHNTTKLRGLGSTMLACARDIAKACGYDVLTLSSVSDSAILKFYNNHKMQYTGGSTFVSFSNSELGALGQINANVIDYMMKHYLTTYDEFLQDIKDKNISSEYFLQDVQNMPRGVLEAILKPINYQNVTFLDRNKMIINNLFQSPNCQTGASIENYALAMHITASGQTQKVLKNMERDKAGKFTIFRHSTALTEFQEKYLKFVRALGVTDTQDVQLYLPLCADTIKDCPDAQVNTHIKVLHATSAALSSKQKLFLREWED